MSDSFQKMKEIMKESKIPYVVTATKDGVIHYIAIEDINNRAIIVFQFGIGDQLIDVYLADEVKSLKEFEQLKDE